MPIVDFTEEEIKELLKLLNAGKKFLDKVKIVKGHNLTADPEYKQLLGLIAKLEKAIT
jgi:hypothetical protein